MTAECLVKLGRAICFSVVFVMTCVSTGGCESRGGGAAEVIGFPQSFADLAERVKPAVVNISTTSKVKVPGTPFRHSFEGQDDQGLRDFFRHFFGNLPDREMKQQSLGSGFIIDPDGHIITNNHMVEGADEIKVKLSDGREFKAKVIGRDAKTDLALIRISSPVSKLPVLVLGDSDKMRVGDWVLAVGIPFGLEHTVTQGIISATGRVIGSGPYDNFLQTDAPINPGNSGGPLVNLKGEVIGINTAIVSGGQGLGFAIPSSLAKSVIAQLREKGKVVRGFIGVSIQTVTPDLAKSFGLPDPRGALIGDVTPDGPADRAGLKQGDVIVTFNGVKVKDANDLPRLVAETPVGKSVQVTVVRNGKEERHTVKVAELTEEKEKSQAPGRQAPEQSLGMELEELTPEIRSHLGISEKRGLVVTGVDDGSQAEEAGIQEGDVLVEANRRPVGTVAELNDALAKAKGRPVLLLVKRGKESFFATLEGE
ncbi:peptidase [Geomonas sp. Red276]